MNVNERKIGHHNVFATPDRFNLGFLSIPFLCDVSQYLSESAYDIKKSHPEGWL